MIIITGLYENEIVTMTMRSIRNKFRIITTLHNVCAVQQGMFSTPGDSISTVGGYHKYTGGVQYTGGIMSTTG